MGEGDKGGGSGSGLLFLCHEKRQEEKMEQITIRKAQPDDAPALLDMQLQLDLETQAIESFPSCFLQSRVNGHEKYQNKMEQTTIDTVYFS